MTLSVIIPVYNDDAHLDICLLSILGQVQMKDIEIVCVPVSKSSEKLKTWRERDSRVIIAQESNNLFEALQQGILTATGSYILFMNQTDIITSIGNIKETIDTAQAKDLQVSLSPILRRKNVNAFASTECIEINKVLLPKDLSEVFSVTDTRSGIILASLPVPYGNIYKRSYLVSLFHGNNSSFSNAGDLMVSTIALLHAERISLSGTALIESRYEDFSHPHISSDELQAAEKKLTAQIMIMLGENSGKTIARNIIVRYLAWIISSYHPFSLFCQAKEHYKDIILPITDMTKDDAIPELFPYWQFLQMSCTSTDDNLIEVYGLSNTLQAYEQQ